MGQNDFPNDLHILLQYKTQVFPSLCPWDHSRSTRVRVSYGGVVSAPLCRSGSTGARRWQRLSASATTFTVSQQVVLTGQSFGGEYHDLTESSFYTYCVWINWYPSSKEYLTSLWKETHPSTRFQPILCYLGGGDRRWLSTLHFVSLGFDSDGDSTVTIQ